MISRTVNKHTNKTYVVPTAPWDGERQCYPLPLLRISVAKYNMSSPFSGLPGFFVYTISLLLCVIFMSCLNICYSTANVLSHTGNLLYVFWTFVMINLLFEIHKFCYEDQVK